MGIDQILQGLQQCAADCSCRGCPYYHHQAGCIETLAKDARELILTLIKNNEQCTNDVKSLNATIAEVNKELAAMIADLKKTLNKP